jgi:hypothetical protein
MLSFKYLFLLIVGVFGHARLTFPTPRIKNVDGGLNAPIYTCLGPAFKTSPTSMRCHDAPSGNIAATYTSGSMVDLEWVMEAPHPGDCSIWLSYDTNVDSPVNWIKIKDIPGCLSINGVDLPIGLNRFSFKLPDFLPSCEHCVLRWEWYAVQQVSNVEFYVNCADIKIVSLNNCQRPTPVTQINGIEHLLYNLNDPKQKGCPFYNVYDINIRPPLQTRSRGPKEWVPVCNDINNPTPTPVPTLQPPIVYPCANINCGVFGSCNNNICICKNGYTGKNCEIPPTISCNTNCKIFNRNTCQINNICGDCLKGFVGDNNIANSLCKIQCDNAVCKNLNRKTCIGGNVCGNCLNGFTEPKYMKKSESCIQSNTNLNGIKLSISSQWKTGFCGQWTTICPQNRIISFEVPNEIRDLRGWNMINMLKVDNVITGYCASWIQEGKQASGGFCASFSFGKIVTIGKNGYVISQQSNRFRMLEIIDESYNNVSITVNVDPNSLDHEPVYNEIQKNLYGTQEIMLLGLENSELSIKIKCENRQDFDNALFLDMNSINPQFNPEPIADEYDYNTLNASNRLNVSFLSLTFLILSIILI